MNIPSHSVSAMVVHDLTIFSPDGHLVVAVQIKAGKDDASERLERSRRALMIERAGEVALFYLQAQRNGLFHWSEDAGAGAEPEIASAKASSATTQEGSGGV